MMNKKRLRLFIILGSILTFVLVLVLSFFIYTGSYYSSFDVDQYLTSTDTVSVSEQDGYYKFDANSEDVLIFYPGAKVEEKAYAPLCMEIAKHNITVYLVQMPYHLAFFDTNAADRIISLEKDKNIYMMGHSLGGAIMGSYASKTDMDLKGLIFLASYCTSDLSNKSFKSLSIYGSLDTVLDKEKYDNNIKNQPTCFKEVVIDGGNHRGFAYYGPQKNDTDALISIDLQITLTSSLVVDFIQ